MRTDPLLAFLALAPLVLAAGCRSSEATAPKSGDEPCTGTGTIVLTVSGFESTDGRALVALFLDAKGFPNDVERAHARAEAAIDGASLTFTFEDVPSGSFAISAFHDADGDYELDKNQLGIPEESWGVSRDAEGWFGPPSFDQARLGLQDGDTLAVDVPLG